jgi:hypothetical protein
MMAKRRTIGKDPLSMADQGYSAEIVPMPIAAPARPPDAAPAPNPPPHDDGKPVVIDSRWRRAVGGRLEILGGDLGVGSRAIWPLKDDASVGFVAPNGRPVDLLREHFVVQAFPDRTDRRYLSAAGWAWVFASLSGFVGLLAAGGLRLLEPRRMIVAIELRDGAKLVARTDSVTVAGLKACAEAGSAAKA